LVVVSRVAPTKGDRVADQGNEAVVGDGDAMGVMTEITQGLLSTSERRFGVDMPVVSE